MQRANYYLPELIELENEASYIMSWLHVRICLKWPIHFPNDNLALQNDMCDNEINSSWKNSTTATDIHNIGISVNSIAGFIHVHN